LGSFSVLSKLAIVIAIFITETHFHNNSNTDLNLELHLVLIVIQGKEDQCCQIAETCLLDDIQKHFEAVSVKMFHPLCLQM